MKGLVVHSDSNRLKQAMLNILSNSFKFTFEGFIKITLKIIEKENNKSICISVEDSGIGIKDSDMSKVFELFGMVSDKKLGNLKGNGIGLNVTQKYIQHLEGQITLESQYGKGTSVRIFLPLSKLPSEIEKRLDAFDFPSIGEEIAESTDKDLVKLFNETYSRMT